MKKSILTVLPLLALAGCSQDDYIGTENIDGQAGCPIAFGTSSQEMTRANAALETLEGTMKVYGAKYVSSAYEKAFGNYAVWNEGTAWEYIGETTDAKKKVTIAGVASQDFSVPQKQIQKYWDYSADHYWFWSIAPYDKDNVTFKVDASADATKKGMVTSATIKGVNGHLTANATTTATTYKKYYIAKPVKVEKANYAATVDGTDKMVNFVFDCLSAQVRVGIYEIIPGYKVTSVTFYDNKTTPGSGQNMILRRDDAAFVGKKDANSAATITYTNDATPTYSVDYSGMTAQTWIAFGKLSLSSSASMGTSSSAPSWGTDGDLGTSNYFSVLPTPSSLIGKKPVTIKMDFTIEGEDADKETITIKGAEAVIPAEYSSWLPNHAYTYIFKITEKTTGGSETPGLYPIVFDAEASSILDNQTGTTTQLGTTNITTCQDGSAVTAGVSYQAGKDIVAYIMQGATYIVPSSSNVQVLQMAAGMTYDGTTTNTTDITDKVTFDATNKKLTIGKDQVKSTQDLVIIYTDADATKSANKIIDL